jgi:RNA polymerase sigma-70 factor (ECF subfamily)
MTTAVLENTLGQVTGFAITPPAWMDWVTPAPSQRSVCPEAPFASPSDLDDAAWIARVQTGDEDAARALFQRLYPTVIKSVRRHLPRRTSEEDLVQAVFAKIFSKLSQFSGRVPLEHWVARITINTCLSQLMHETVRPELRMSDLSPEEETMVQHLATSEEDLPGEGTTAAREVLEKILGYLKPEERLIITLVHIEERSTHEIHELTGWSISRIKVKAFRARHKMRRVWKKLVGTRGA